MLKDVKGFEGRYQVNELGEIFNSKGREMHPHLNAKTGYLQLCLRKNGRPFLCYVHRVVAEAFLPFDSSRTEVNHKDLNKQNNRPENLEWVTRKENVAHAIHAGVSHRKRVRAVKVDNPAEAVEFDSIAAATVFCGAKYRTYISNALRGVRSEAHGYIWRYI